MQKGDKVTLRATHGKGEIYDGLEGEIKFLFQDYALVKLDSGQRIKGCLEVSLSLIEVNQEQLF